MNIYSLSAFLLYFAILLAIGIICHTKQRSSADFVMGSRSLNFWLVALSAHASDMSAWLFMGLPMVVFLSGLPQVWIVLGLTVGMFLNWQFVAPALRTQTEKYGCYTLSSFFEKRFNDSLGVIRIVSAIMFLLFLTHYLSAGMIGIGTLLEALFGINYYFGIIIALVIVVIYTLIGGFTTVAWTDLFQGLFLLVMIMIVPLLALTKLESIDQIALIAQAKQIPLTLLPDTHPITVLNTLLLALSWGVGYFGMPHVITKFMGIKDVSEMHKSKWLGMSWQTLTLGAAVLIGLVGIAYFPDGLENPQMVFVEMVKSLFHPFIGGFILCGVIAASMSTMDSQILVCASVLSEDLYPQICKQAPSSLSRLKASRIGVILISVIALALSLNKSTTIMDTVSYSWYGLGSSFGPVVLCALYSKKANKYGAMAGIVSGGVIVMLWPYLNPLITNYPIQSMIPGFFLSLLIIHVVSYITREAPNDTYAVQEKP